MTSQQYTTLPTDSYYFDATPSTIKFEDLGKDVQQTSPGSSNHTSSRPLMSYHIDDQLQSYSFGRKSPTLIEYETNDPIEISAISTSYHQTNLRFDTDSLSSTVRSSLPSKPIDIKALTLAGVPIKFPFTPYQAQVQMMSKILTALQKKQHAVLESPTGSGKTLALLCGVLAWRDKEKEKRATETATILTRLQNETDVGMGEIDFMGDTDIDEDIPKPIPRIFIGSRTHKQVAQVVRELERRTIYRPKMSVLGSRDQYCVHREVMKSANKQEECTYLTNNHNCRHQNKVDKLIKDPRIQPGGANEVWDIEDLTELGKETGGCPYYASRSIAETAELIICPYNYLIDPMIRKAMNIQLDGNIIVLDEAHNIENVSRDSGTIELDSDVLKFMAVELTQVIQNGHIPSVHGVLLKLIDDILKWMYDPSHHFVSEDDNQHLHLLSAADEIKRTLDIFFGINASTMMSTFGPVLQLATKHIESMKNRKTGNPDDMVTDEANTQDNQISTRTHMSITNLNRFEGLFMVLDFLLDDSNNGVDDYRLALIKNVGSRTAVGNSWERRLGFWCMNSAVVFRDIAEQAHSVILTSGTLTPVTTFEAELDTKFPIQLEANHVIKPDQVSVLNIPSGPSGNSLKAVYSTTSKTGYQDDLGEAIVNISNIIPFGILVFVTSYSLLDKLCARWKSTGLLSRIEAKKHFLKEPRGGSTELFEKVLKKFYGYIKLAENGVGNHDGAIFLAVYRGKVSEGIDFNNNNCRAVVATGIPYPMWKDTKVMLKRSYNDKRWRNNNAFLSGDQWYNIQAFRAINQALGRCIRHRDDWGSILLLEERFLDDRNSKHLSKWIRKLCKSRMDPFEAIMADLNEFTQRRLKHDLEIKALLPKQDGIDLDEHLQLLLKDKSSNEESYMEVDHISISSTETDILENQQNCDMDFAIENDTEYYNTKETISQNDSADTYISDRVSIVSSPAGTPTPSTPISQPPLCANYKINCNYCHQPLVSWPPLPITGIYITTNLHYFTSIMSAYNDQHPTNSAEILEVNYVYCMEYEKRFDHNRAPIFDRMNVSELEQEVQDVEWDPIDSIVYRPYITQCCDQVVGADILTTTLGASAENTELIGKLWLLKDLVDVTDGDTGL